MESDRHHNDACKTIPRGRGRFLRREKPKCTSPGAGSTPAGSTSCFHKTNLREKKMILLILLLLLLLLK